MKKIIAFLALATPFLAQAESSCLRPVPVYLINLTQNELKIDTSRSSEELKEDILKNSIWNQSLFTSGSNQKEDIKKWLNSKQIGSSMFVQDFELSMSPQFNPNKTIGERNYCVVVKNMKVDIKLSPIIKIPSEYKNSDCLIEQIKIAELKKYPSKNYPVMRTRLIVNEKIKQQFYEPFFVSTPEELQKVVADKNAEVSRVLSEYFMQPPNVLKNTDIDTSSCPANQQLKN